MMQSRGERKSGFVPTSRIYESDVKNVSSRAFLCRYVVRVAILQAHHVGCHISRISEVRVTSQLPTVPKQTHSFYSA